MLVATGFTSPSAVTNTIEYIDLSSTTTKCTGFGSNTLPLYLNGAVGGLGVAGLPHICGGFPDASGSSLTATNACYVGNGNGWAAASALPNAVGAAAVSASPFPAAAFFVTGGMTMTPSLQFNYYSATQSVGYGVWTSIPSLPVGLAFHCQVQLSATTVMVIGGATQSSTGYSSVTYLFSTQTNKWTTGPPLAKGRETHACARILTDGTANKYSTIVVGGFVAGG